MKATIILALAAIASASPLTKRSWWQGVQTNDDSDGSVTFSVGDDWTHLSNQGNIAHGGSLSYSKSGCASYSFSAYPFYNLNLTIYAGKKYDRGNFDVYLDGNKIGSGSAYDGSASDDTSPQVVYQQTGIDTTNAKTFTVKNTQGNGPYLAFDFAEQGYEGGPA